MDDSLKVLIGEHSQSGQDPFQSPFWIKYSWGKPRKRWWLCQGGRKLWFVLYLILQLVISDNCTKQLPHQSLCPNRSTCRLQRTSPAWLSGASMDSVPTTLQFICQSKILDPCKEKEFVWKSTPMWLKYDTRRSPIGCLAMLLFCHAIWDETCSHNKTSVNKWNDSCFSPCRAVLEEDPYCRMKQILRWYLSGFYKKPKVKQKCMNHIQVYNQIPLFIFIFPIKSHSQASKFSRSRGRSFWIDRMIIQSYTFKWILKRTFCSQTMWKCSSLRTKMNRQWIPSLIVVSLMWLRLTGSALSDLGVGCCGSGWVGTGSMMYKHPLSLLEYHSTWSLFSCVSQIGARVNNVSQSVVASYL